MEIDIQYIYSTVDLFCEISHRRIW